MANRSFLVLNRSGDPAEEYSSQSVIVAASWIVPVCWFSLFGAEDRTMGLASIENDEDDTDEVVQMPSNGEVTYPVLLARTEVAQRRASTGRDAFLAFFPEHFGRYYDEWMVLISGLDTPYVVLDAAEIWNMIPPDTFDKLLQDGVKAFTDGNRSDWINLCKQTGMKIDPQSGDVVFEEEGLAHRLHGYWWERPVPWK